MLTTLFADATDVIAAGIVYFILIGVPLIAFIFGGITVAGVKRNTASGCKT